MPGLMWHGKPRVRVLQDLNVDSRHGLDQAEVERRLDAYGYNELTSAQASSALRLLFRQFHNVLIIVLLGAAALSAIVILVLFSALLGFFQEMRAERAVEGLKRMLAPTSRVRREQRTMVVPARELVPGDIVILEAGDRVPADIRLLESHSLHCDAAPLTGESAPRSMQSVAQPEDTPVAERSNCVYGGTTITFGRGRGVVTETGMHSALACRLSGILR